MHIDETMKIKFVKLGENIRRLREERNITLKELAQKTEIRIAYLAKIEEGIAYGVLLEKHLSKIATVLNIRLSEMFDF